MIKLAYDQAKASPSQEAHDAAAALDFAFEGVSDGLSIGDIEILSKVRPLIAYLFEEGIPKGEAISRAVQLVSLVERDNSILSGAIPNE